MDPLSIADVFRSDLFRNTSLTAAINAVAYLPQRLMELDIFEVNGIATTTAFIEKKGETLSLVQSSARGGPGQSVAIDRRDAIPFQCVHLALEDKIYADEIQNVRGFGTNQLAGIQEVRDQKLIKMSRYLDLTLEYQRLGAIQGVILDADATPIADLFDLFGIAEPDDVNLELDDAWTQADGSPVKKKITGLLRGVDVSLGGNLPTGYWAACGDNFFDALEGHPERRDTQRALEGVDMRSDGRRSFTYGGVTWENYKGIGAVAVDTNEARLVPLGVPGLFQQLFSPADTMAAANTMGQVKYSMAAPDPSGLDKFIALESQSNPITYCTRPSALRRVIIT